MRLKRSKIGGVRKIYTLVVLVLGIAIIFVSFVRASLEISAQEDNEGKSRGDIIEVEIEKSNGERIIEVYQIPQVRMLPTNIFYGIKEIRDYLWLQFSRDNFEKIKMAMFLADKNLAESVVLSNKGQKAKALKSGEKAVDKLEYAWTMLGGERDNRSIDLRNKIYRAVIVYDQMIRKMGGEGVDKNKYEEIENKIKTFKEKEEKFNLG
ncbi:hypothetical protein COS78_01375 [Candidatus Shapirobacteria bacterium CG06_land_8_20_14_3_00_40_12]|uniref:DUF5667 domain-containing protein n=2 Tax=Candidatus Shapironibacteriota TaxID=1752721 RepID=A0A2M7TS29_9BACT|nr:MAG: hypothetical protein COS78_01375 [Candidatus Shapirobacteria bacterium CG06_land_8_20_14_3_00_40_12]PIZ58369.1 MAG: hypothetical protein COY20_03720 [Candidatus Shapirobacteria bacterium CG_4_10_14_0_2_um_filter_40_12]